MGARVLDVGFSRAVVARVSLTGELGYEITVRGLRTARALGRLDSRR